RALRDRRLRLDGHLSALEAGVGRRLGDPQESLLVSVAAEPPVSSGAGSAFSHVGLCHATVDGYAALIGDESAAWSRYERLVRAFAIGVRGVPADRLSPPVPDAGPAAVRARLSRHLTAIAAASGRPFPQDPREQLGEVMTALLEAGGAAAGTVTVQAMVHGDAVGLSGSGTAFTRSPATGEPWMAGDFFPRAERARPAGAGHAVALDQLARWSPPVYAALQRVAGMVEATLLDLAEIDFVVERSRLWVIDVRVAPRSAVAALTTALDLWHQGAVDLTEALARIPPVALIRVAEAGLDTYGAVRLGHGIGVSPGVAAGPLVLSGQDGRRPGGPAATPVLVAGDDAEAEAVLSAGAVVSPGGGHASHLAALTRGLEHPAVCRVSGLIIGARQARFGSVVVSEGQEVSIDGCTGEVFLGACPRAARRPGDELVELLLACDDQRRLPLLAEGHRATWADGIFDSAAAAVCRSPEEIDAALAADQPVAVSPGPRAPLRLVEIARELAGYGIDVMLRIDRSWPRSLVRLPAVPWSALITTPEAAGAGRMLAALLAPEPVPGAWHS
ncbi:MAG: PEP-utilizing enzyme, partial [Actinomycetota bacterium]|nr:PEP-utilizing enzyme [Actinomycetota bacterium]